MRLKQGVKVTGMRPELILAIMAAEDEYRAIGKEFVITSMLDGKHSETSLHYAGAAFDVRVYPDMDVSEMAASIKARLGVDYDVVQEDSHIHVESQARYGGT